MDQLSFGNDGISALVYGYALFPYHRTIGCVQGHRKASEDNHGFSSNGLEFNIIKWRIKSLNIGTASGGYKLSYVLSLPVQLLGDFESAVKLANTVLRKLNELQDQTLILYFAARHHSTPALAKLLAFAIVAYVLSPIDLIPDFIPVLGMLDELLLVPLFYVLLVRLIPETVIDECRERVFDQKRLKTRIQKHWSVFLAAFLVILVWLCLAFFILKRFL